MRQISGEVYAAAQASTCCDVTGEESPNGAPRKMHAFCGVPGLDGGILTYPRDEQPIRSVLEHNEQLERVSLSTTKPLHPQEGG